MRICFAGTPQFAVPPLRAILRSRHEVCLVITQPDQPAGRGRRATPPPVKQTALAEGIPVIQPSSINDPEAVERISRAAPDAVLVIAYGKMLSRQVLGLPKLGCFNVHASLLPKYRGAAPIAHAILNGESETGLTIQRMAPRMDSGPILFARRVEIGPEETAGELSDRLAALAAEEIVPVLDAIESGTAVEMPQDESAASFAPKLTKADGLVPWRLEARALCNFIRAMTPWPGAYSFLRSAAGDDRGRVILLAARPAPCAGAGSPGQVVRADGELVVAAGCGCISILKLQPAGRRPMSAAAFISGRSVKIGDMFHGA